MDFDKKECEAQHNYLLSKIACHPPVVAKKQKVDASCIVLYCIVLYCIVLYWRKSKFESDLFILEIKIDKS